ncbi:putative protein CXorf51B [Galemys pyrenaicus]|uniref:Spermatid nuclear transition protein 4-like n=1 Tax=Galemys pyrenaicus TaxID=202257 RepID=A0A8J6DIC2_GALPY|nr:putative protein CXorf51B [Galemys pyrenaicus]
MAKVTKKPPEPTLDKEQPTSSSKQNKKAKTSRQPRSKVGDKVIKTSRRVKRPLRGTVQKKNPAKRVSFLTKDRKDRRQSLFGHYRKLNEKLKQNEVGQDQDSVKKSTTNE